MLVVEINPLFNNGANEIMNKYDVKRLALVLAVQAEIEGMKAENIKCKQHGSENCYNQAEFNHKAEELRILASKHNDQLMLGMKNN